MNRVFLMGRLTKDPELRYTTNNNTAVCSFTLAVDRRFSRQGEEKQADFINIVAWTHTAEFCSKYFYKGLRVVVEGRIQTRTWDDTEGKRHYATEVVADDVHFADGKRSDAPMGGNSGSSQNNNNNSDGFYALDDDDELPF